MIKVNKSYYLCVHKENDVFMSSITLDGLKEPIQVNKEWLKKDIIDICNKNDLSALIMQMLIVPQKLISLNFYSDITMTEDSTKLGDKLK